MTSINELKKACKRKDLNAIKSIINQSPDFINEMVYDSDGNTLLMKACLEGWDEIVKYLISNYSNIININQQNEEGKSALYQAVSKGNANCARALLSHPQINVNLQSNEGKSALYRAVSNDELDCLRVLLSHPDIDVNLQHEEWKKPVLWYCKNRECFDLLLPYYRLMKEHEKAMAWIWVIYKNRIGGLNEVKEIFQPFTNVSLSEMRDDISKLVLIAAKRGDKNILQYLLSFSGDIININIQDENGESALYKAVSKGKVDCVKLLLSRLDIDLNLQNEDGESALYEAVSKGNVDCVKELLSRPSIDLNLQCKDGESALYKAVSEGNVDCVKLLLSRPNIDLNLQYEEWNKTVLWYCENRECFDLLLPRYPLMKEHEKTMAWIWAMYQNRIGGLNEVKEIMGPFSKDVASEMRDDVSMLVLIVAERGDKDMLEYLLSSYGDIININIQNKDGRTPLHLAMYYERRDCIDILLNLKDIDVTIRDKDGKTADEIKSAGRIVYEIELVERKPNPSIMEMDLLSKQKFVRWNRSKIMLVGQGRAGKTVLANNLAGIWIEDTVSTIGAEQMEMKVLYGGVKGGRLQKYERPQLETEALLAEELHSKNQKIRSRIRNLEISSKYLSMDSPQVEAQVSSIEEHQSQKKKMSFIIPLKSGDIKPDKVEIHYRQLQEVDTASNYKLLLVDFGGQSLFNIFHGFFMSRYGIYLVVFDMELFLSGEESKRNSCRKELRFWLNSITMHTFDNSTGKTAPFAIVGARGDKISNEEDYKMISLELEDMFGEMMVWKSLILNNGLCFFPNNNTLTENNPVSAKLLRFIETSLEHADYLQRDIPILWIKIFDEMRSLQQSYLSYEEVIRISREKYQDVRESLIENEEDVEELDREILIQVKEMLRFLNDMGMLMWIEEKDLEDVIILDPIEYLVKPATTIICKHLATNDDPYGTIHHIAEIHGASREAYGEDWERMLEYGLVSEELARDLLMRYFDSQDRSNHVIRHDLIDKILLCMTKFGLMIPSTALSISSAKKFYLVPSLLPLDPSPLDSNVQDGEIKMMLNRLHRRYSQMFESWNSIESHFSLFCFLSQEGSFPAKFYGYSVMSSSELSQQGFLPHSLFERMICRLIQRMCGHDSNRTMDERLVDNDLIIGFRGRVQISYQDCDIRIIERQEENRIEVMVQSRETDRKTEKEVLVEIYKVIAEVIELLLRECFENLQVKTVIHFPEVSTSISSTEKGFITLKSVRELLSTSDPFEMARPLNLISYHAKCEITLIPKEMKEDPYWSVWKEEVNIPLLPANSAVLPLRAGKKTHVFLSHDWGVDGNNHRRVKQISDGLKSRGLITWIDDEWIVNEIDGKIIDGIDHTECMIVFLTENYVSKVDSKNDKDYCKREFDYGFDKLGREKTLVVVLDESMRDSSKWGGTIPFNLGFVVDIDMSMIFEPSTSLLEANELFDNLSRQVIEYGKNQWERKVMSLLSQQSLVKWNRSKIMLVGQGRAGKTALANNLAGIWIEDTVSTIGAEMEMKVLYGGVKGGRLQKYERPERETEALLAEQLHSKTHQESTSSSLSSKGDAKSVNVMPPPLDDFHTTKENKSPPSFSKDTSLQKQRDSDLPLVEQKSPETKEYSSISAESVLNDSYQNSAPILKRNENPPRANVALESVPSDSFTLPTLPLRDIKLDEDNHCSHQYQT